jgi:hypothetical protein
VALARESVPATQNSQFEIGPANYQPHHSRTAQSAVRIAFGNATWRALPLAPCKLHSLCTDTRYQGSAGDTLVVETTCSNSEDSICPKGGERRKLSAKKLVIHIAPFLLPKPRIQLKRCKGGRDLLRILRALRGFRTFGRWGP